jgi:hypothetical protein
MMNVNPVGGVHPAFDSWLERRRQRMQAQLAALDAERFGDLADLLDRDRDDRPPAFRRESDREQYRQMLREQEKLVERLALVRRRLLMEIKDVERQQVSGVAQDRVRSLGGSLDGYL